jgi:hypothetical protein
MVQLLRLDTSPNNLGHFFRFAAQKMREPGLDLLGIKKKFGLCTRNYGGKAQDAGRDFVG